MIITNAGALARAIRRHRDAAPALRAWLRVVEEAQWRSIVDVRKVYPSADGVEVESGNIVTVFNIRGNNYRLVTQISYRAAVVNVIELLTHVEYDREKWKRRI